MSASLIQSWLIITSKFEALNKRERWLVFITLLFLVYAAINMLLLNPVLTRKKILSTEMSTDQSQIQVLQLQITALNSQNVADPDVQNKQRIAELKSNLQQVEIQLSGMQNTLVSPDKMPELLRSLLKKNGKLKLVSLKTLPTKGLIESMPTDENSAIPMVSVTVQKPTIKASQQDAPVFKHGVEITLEGRYLDLLDYVANLEKMPWHVLWSKVDLSVKDYPLSQLKLTVYTLSLDKTWLSI